MLNVMSNRTFTCLLGCANRHPTQRMHGNEYATDVTDYVNGGV